MNPPPQIGVTYLIIMHRIEKLPASRKQTNKKNTLHADYPATASTYARTHTLELIITWACIHSHVKVRDAYVISVF